MASLTSANAIITLAIPNLFPIPQQLQGFSADNIFDIDAVEAVQTSMGVDGILSGGFVFNEKTQGFTLQADSATNAMFEAWAAAQEQLVDVYTCNGTTILPAVGRSYVMSKGFLVSYPPMPGASKILQPRKYTLKWERIVSNPIQ